MKVKNENFTPRERVNRELLDRMLAESAREEAAERSPLPQFSGTQYPNTPASTCSCYNYKKQCKVHKEYGCEYPSSNAATECKENYVCKSPVYPGVSLAMVYSPCQAFADLYEPEAGIERGTIFKELDKPFYPTPCNERWCK